MNSGLDGLVEVSRRFGGDPQYVIAGGGNTSWKDDHWLWVKASGVSLAGITADGFVKMDRSRLSGLSKGKYSADPIRREAEIKSVLSDCVAERTDKRPSVETLLHNLLSFSYVVHTHPTLVNAVMCSNRWAEVAQELFGNDALLVEYTDPGYTLFKLVERRISDYMRQRGREPGTIFLQNHGVFVASDSTAGVYETYSRIIGAIQKRIMEPAPAATPTPANLSALVSAACRELGTAAEAYTCNLVQEFVRSREAFSPANTALTPDNIVYCGSHYLFTTPDPAAFLRDCRVFQRRYGRLSRVIGIEKAGIICLEEDKPAIRTVADVFLDMLEVCYYSRNFGGRRPLTGKEIEFIENWEAESYRRKMAASPKN